MEQRRGTTPASTMQAMVVAQAAWRMLTALQQQQNEGFPRHSNPFRYHVPPNPSVKPFRSQQVTGLIPWMLQILKCILLGSLLLLLSSTSYAQLYHFLMPSRYATVPLYFDYSPTNVIETNMVAAPPPPSFFSFRSSSGGKTTIMEEVSVVPVAHVDLFAKHVAWQALTETVAPPLITPERLLQARQSYYIELLLHLPESIHNRQAGLFGVVTHLQSHTPKRTNLARSTRWTQLPHESHWISVVRKILYLPALLVGAMTEFRTVQLATFRHYVECRDQPLRYVTVELQRHSAQQTLIEVMEGELRIGKELNMFQELLKEWYYTGFFLGSLSFALLYYSLFTLSYEWLQRVGFFRVWHGLEEPDCDLDLDFSLGGNYHEEDVRNFPRRGSHGERNPPQEPHFEDWQDMDPSAPSSSSSSSPQPPTATPVPPPAPQSTTVAQDCTEEEEDGDDWQDMFFDTAETNHGTLE